MDRRAFLASATALAAGTGGCFGLGAASDYDVGMSGMDFLPAEYRITPGTTVVWKNTSSRAHTVTAYEATLPGEAPYFASGGYASESAARNAWTESGGGAIYAGDTYEHTFDVEGRFPYFCIPHEREGMTGAIVVSATAATSESEAAIP